MDSSGSLFSNIICASSAACIAELTTIPIDTLKVRMMIQGEKKNLCVREAKIFKPKYNNFIDCARKIYLEEGITSFFKGLSSGLQRQVIFGGIRIGFYPIVKNKLTTERDPLKIPLYIKMLSALITGTFAIIIASPADVVKIRLQADGNKKADQRIYNGSLHAYQTIIKKDGYKGLYRGLLPNIYRNSTVNCFELSSYDQFKTIIMKKLSIIENSNLLNLICGFMSGIVAISFSSPFDVIKTRIMNDNEFRYKGFYDCLNKSIRHEGYGVLYSGYLPSLLRVSSWNAMCFYSLEQIRPIFIQKNHYQ